MDPGSRAGRPSAARRGGQKQLREQLGLVARDQAVLFDALNTLPARVDGLRIAMAPTLERLDRLDLLLRGFANQVREQQA